MMKVRTEDTDRLFEKSFAKYVVNSEKTLMSARFSKRFLFAICSPLLKKAVEVLASSISVKC